jgi:hypothetical protein
MFAAYSLANGFLQALKPLKDDDEQPGDPEDGNEVHLVDRPSKKFKEQHELFLKNKRTTPETAFIPNLLLNIMEMHENLALSHRTLLVLSFICKSYLRFSKCSFLLPLVAHRRKFSAAGLRIK